MILIFEKLSEDDEVLMFDFNPLECTLKNYSNDDNDWYPTNDFDDELNRLYPDLPDQFKHIAWTMDSAKEASKWYRLDLLTTITQQVDALRSSRVFLPIPPKV
jgi:hypothetical protein